MGLVLRWLLDLSLCVSYRSSSQTAAQRRGGSFVSGSSASFYPLC